MRPTICSLLEPHHKQNPYTNPKRTAKCSPIFTRPIHIDSTRGLLVQNLFSKNFPSPREGEPPLKESSASSNSHQASTLSSGDFGSFATTDQRLRGALPGECP